MTPSSGISDTRAGNQLPNLVLYGAERSSTEHALSTTPYHIIFLQIFRGYLLTTLRYSSKLKDVSVVSVEAVMTLYRLNLVLIICRCRRVRKN